MKKFFSVLLLSTLLVSGCSAHNSSSKTSKPQSAGSTKNENINYTFNYETDAQPDIGQIPDEAYTKNGVYHVKYVNDDYYQITFTDKKSKKTVPLCTKPNCSHKTIDCDANLPVDLELSNGESYVGS